MEIWNRVLFMAGDLGLGLCWGNTGGNEEHVGQMLTHLFWTFLSSKREIMEGQEARETHGALGRTAKLPPPCPTSCAEEGAPRVEETTQFCGWLSLLSPGKGIFGNPRTHC